MEDKFVRNTAAELKYSYICTVSKRINIIETVCFKNLRIFIFLILQSRCQVKDLIINFST